VGSWDGARVRIVDFEDAALSDPATELALLVEHMSTRALDSEALCAAFPVDPVRLRRPGARSPCCGCGSCGRVARRRNAIHPAPTEPRPAAYSSY
jgi:hypothetical protein